MRVLGLIKIDFTIVKKGFFFIQIIIQHYFQSYFDQKQRKKKLAFLEDHGQTPLEKCDFGDFLKNDSQKRFLLYLEKNSTLFLVLFRPETKKQLAVFQPKLLEKCNFGEFELLAKKVSFLSRTLQCIKQGLKLTKFSGRLFATTWRNKVARCKFLVASLYRVNDADQGL